MKHYIELEKDECILIDLTKDGEFSFQFCKIANKDGMKIFPTPISQSQVRDINLVFDALQIDTARILKAKQESLEDYIRRLIESGCKVAITYEKGNIRYSLYSADEMVLLAKFERLEILENFVHNENNLNI